MDNMRDSLSLVILVIVFIVFVGVVFIWGYNFMALSDDKLFDADNKYLNVSLSNPDVESNYKDTYKNKLKFDNIQLGFMDWFSGFKGIFIIAFLLLFLLGLILKNRQTLMKNLKNMFD